MAEAQLICITNLSYLLSSTSKHKTPQATHEEALAASAAQLQELLDAHAQLQQALEEQQAAVAGKQQEVEGLQESMKELNAQLGERGHALLLSVLGAHLWVGCLGAMALAISTTR